METARAMSLSDGVSARTVPPRRAKWVLRWLMLHFDWQMTLVDPNPNPRQIAKQSIKQSPPASVDWLPNASRLVCLFDKFSNQSVKQFFICLTVDRSVHSTNPLNFRDDSRYFQCPVPKSLFRATAQYTTIPLLKHFISTAFLSPPSSNRIFHLLDSTLRWR